MFLTQGFVYETVEHAEQRFIKSVEDAFIYALYGNPTVAIFKNASRFWKGQKQRLPLPKARRQSMAR